MPLGHPGLAMNVSVCGCCWHSDLANPAFARHPEVQSVYPFPEVPTSRMHLQLLTIPVGVGTEEERHVLYRLARACGELAGCISAF